MFDNKVAVSGLVATGLLLLFAISSFFVLHSWMKTYKSDLEVGISVKDFDSNIEVMKVDGTKLYIKNRYRNDLGIKSIEVAGRDCNVSNVLIDKGLAVVDIAGCTYGLDNLTMGDIVVLTTDGLLQEYDVIENPIVSMLVVLPEMGPCDFASGYVRLFGLSDLDNAHVDIDGTYTYNICVRNLNHSLGTVSSGNFVNILYLTDVVNSAAWTEKGSIYSAPAQWYNLSVSTSGGSLFFAINETDMTGDGYQCLARVDKDDVYGAHAGSCDSGLSHGLWLRMEG